MDERFAVKNYDGAFAGRSEVADSRTPLSALLEGEPEERGASAAFVVRAADHIAERVMDALDGEEVDLELLTDLIRKEIEGEILEVRLITIRTMLRYLWQGARSPWDAMKTLLAVTRLTAQSLINGVSQAEVAYLLRETKAATCAREKKRVEGFLRAWGVQGFHSEGAQKSEAARATYSRVQMGNNNRVKNQKPKIRKRK
jgi:hypothetical protein